MIARLLRAWLLTAAVDGLFSSALSAFAYGSTVAQLWRGVASTALGPGIFGGLGPGMQVAAGLMVHAFVALAWSTIFLIVFDRVSALRRIADSAGGVFKIAIVYGPLIWVVMSAVVIPMRTGRPPAITYRWWVQFVGHAVFVGWPIVAMIASGRPRQRAID